MSWFGKLKEGLKNSAAKLTQGLSAFSLKRKLDQEALDELEELLIISDMGVGPAARFVENLKKTRFQREITDQEIREELAGFIESVLTPVMRPLEIDASRRPHIILMVGVNGSGKTTTIAKLAALWAAQGKHVRLVAGDTFRAAAVAQLAQWAQRAGVSLVQGAEGADAASVVYQGLVEARAADDDIVLIDTAGRLQNKTHLMVELDKIKRVIAKFDPSAPHHSLLILDATLGQNAHGQVKHFQESGGVNGLIMTKLDGTARGGILVSLAESFGLPVYALGVGEGMGDLKPFAAHEFAHSLVGLNEQA